MPAGRPDVPPLVQAAALKLLTDGGQPLIASAGNNPPQQRDKRRQSQRSCQRPLWMAVCQQNSAARERHHGRQKPSARGGEQHRNLPQRQVASRQQPPRPAPFAIDQQRRQRKTQVEKTGHVVGVLSGGGKATL